MKNLLASLLLAIITIYASSVFSYELIERGVDDNGDEYWIEGILVVPGELPDDVVVPKVILKFTYVETDNTLGKGIYNEFIDIEFEFNDEWIYEIRKDGGVDKRVEIEITYLPADCTSKFWYSVEYGLTRSTYKQFKCQ